MPRTKPAAERSPNSCGRGSTSEREIRKFLVKAGLDHLPDPEPPAPRQPARPLTRRELLQNAAWLTGRPLPMDWCDRDGDLVPHADDTQGDM